MRIPVAAAAVLLLAGCSSPFTTLGPETGPPEDPESLGTGIHGWPWLDHEWHGDVERADVLWPLVTVREARSGNPPEPDSFLPLFVHSSSPAGVRWGIRPLFDVESREAKDGHVSDTDLLFPIFKSRNAPEEERLEVRPIWWQGRRRDESWLTIFPLWFSRDDAKSSQRLLFPLWYQGTEEDRSWLSVYPFWYERDGPDSSLRLLFPLWARSVAGDVEETFVLPSYYRREEKGEVRDLHVWPFWGMHAEGTFRQDWTLFPFFSIARDPEKELLAWDAPFPLVHYGTSKDSSSIRILPLYVRESSPGKEATVVFPFWWSIADGKTSFRMAFPFWANRKEVKGEEWTSWLGPAWIDWRDGKRATTDVLWPIYRTESDPGGWSSHVFPVLWLDRHGETNAYTHVWPLFGTSIRGKRREVSTVYPFFMYGWGEDTWRLDAPFPFVEIASRLKGWEARAWPLFSAEVNGKNAEGDVLLFLAQWKSSEKESEFRVLWKIFERERTAERTKTALNPLFRHETNARGDSHWSVLFGLLAATTEGDATRWRILWFL